MRPLAYHGSGLLALITDAEGSTRRVDFFGVPTQVFVGQRTIPVGALGESSAPEESDFFPVPPVRPQVISSPGHLRRFVAAADRYCLDVAEVEGVFSSRLRDEAVRTYSGWLREEEAVSEQDILHRVDELGGAFPYRSLQSHLSEEFLEITDILDGLYREQRPARLRDVRLLSEYVLHPSLPESSLQAGLSTRLDVLDDGLLRIVDRERGYVEDAGSSFSARSDYLIAHDQVRKRLHERINQRYFPEL